MSFKQNDTITPGNYEEYFILYVDSELTTSQMAMVDAFVLQHPQLADELDALLITKLPLDDVSFVGKESLLAPAMKLNTVDESLLLYLDDELPSAEKAVVAGRIESDAEYARQYALLLQTKLNATDVVAHPAKKELYRHERRTVPFGMWLRMAAAVVLLLISTWFFFLNKANQTSDSIAKNPQPLNMKPIVFDRPTVVKPLVPKEDMPSDATVLGGQPTAAPLKKTVKTSTVQVQTSPQGDVASSKNLTAPVGNSREVIHLDVSRFATDKNIGNDIAINETITYTPVTSASPDRITDSDPAPTDGDFKPAKKTPARGFFRKVSRFIERRTGIGTANADNELLVGAVALKLN